MIRIQQLKIKPGHSRKQLTEKAARQLKVRPEDIGSVQVWKRSIDARKKPDILGSYLQLSCRFFRELLPAVAGFYF